jgi:hypothetical protein
MVSLALAASPAFLAISPMARAIEPAVRSARNSSSPSPAESRYFCILGASTPVKYTNIVRQTRRDVFVAKRNLPHSNICKHTCVHVWRDCDGACSHLGAFMSQCLHQRIAAQPDTSAQKIKEQSALAHTPILMSTGRRMTPHAARPRLSGKGQRMHSCMRVRPQIGAPLAPQQGVCSLITMHINSRGTREHPYAKISAWPTRREEVLVCAGTEEDT